MSSLPGWFIALGTWPTVHPLSGPEMTSFAWVVKRFGRSGKMVAFLGCRFSFWGSIWGDLVRVVAKHTGAKQVMYFGNLGKTRPFVQPNRYLASGDSSSVPDAGVVSMEEHPSSYTLRSNKLKEDTTHLWKARGINERFVRDEWVVGKSQLERPWSRLCRSGGRADDSNLAAVETGLEFFGYLHIISDNVAQKYDEDLSNKRYKMVNQLLGRECTWTVCLLVYPMFEPELYTYRHSSTSFTLHGFGISLIPKQGPQLSHRFTCSW